MKKAFLKSSMAVALSAATVLANALPVLATAPVTSGTGTGAGTSTGHLDTSYIEASFPTNKTIADYFNFYVDAEDIIGNNTGVKFTADGSAVTANDDLVYFPAESGFASTSQDIEITIKNYEKVDVTATATVSGVEGFTLLEDATTIDNTEAATAAALYLGLKVGDKAYVPILADGATSVAEFAGQKDNFEVTGTAGHYQADPKSGATWGKIVLKMTGKAQLVSDATDITAPTIAFTWAVTLHEDTPALAITNTTANSTDEGVDFNATFTKGTALTLSATGLTACKWSSTKDGTYNTSSNITVNNGTVTIAAGNWGSAGAGDVRYLKVTIDDNDYIIKVTIATA